MTLCFLELLYGRIFEEVCIVDSVIFLFSTVTLGICIVLSAINKHDLVDGVNVDGHMLMVWETF